MQLRSKLLFGLVAAVLVVGMMASTANAQINITVAGNGAASEVLENRNALTNDRDSTNAGLTISGALVANSALTQTDLVITYPAQITSNSAVANNTVPTGEAANLPIGDPIRIVSASSLFASVSIGTIDYDAGEITLTHNGKPPPLAVRLEEVRPSRRAVLVDGLHQRTTTCELKETVIGEWQCQSHDGLYRIGRVTRRPRHRAKATGGL